MRNYHSTNFGCVIMYFCLRRNKILHCFVKAEACKCKCKCRLTTPILTPIQSHAQTPRAWAWRFWNEIILKCVHQINWNAIFFFTRSKIKCNIIIKRLAATILIHLQSHRTHEQSKRWRIWLRTFCPQTFEMLLFLLSRRKSRTGGKWNKLKWIDGKCKKMKGKTAAQCTCTMLYADNSNTKLDRD